jgi:hypothetical protein
MRFSIRDLLWLTLVAAFAVAWWVDRSRLQSRLETVELRHRAEAELAEANLSTAMARAKFQEALADAALARAKVMAALEEAQAKAMQAQDLRSDEGPVQGYKLLGPRPTNLKPE